MNNDLKAYYENMRKPWWKMFYKIVWEQMPKVTNSKILDYGSGLGITANHFAENNDVTAIDPNNDMIELRMQENSYQQIIGGIEQLRQLKDNSFDVVVCHNVLEYAQERKDIFKEFYRILKPNGILSIIKHNHNGRIMAKIIFENNLDEAIKLLNGEPSSAAYFGEINYYDIDDIKEWIGILSLNIEKVLGIRTFYGLHPDNEIRYDPIWDKKMFEIEMKASGIKDYANIAFYNHILLRKIS